MDKVIYFVGKGNDWAALAVDKACSKALAGYAKQ